MAFEFLPRRELLTIVLPPRPPLMLSPQGSVEAEMRFANIEKPGNAADITGYGKVDYSYRVGTYEVTNYEYTSFLNSVAQSDPYDLYDPRMATDMGGYTAIVRTGDPGSFQYAVSENLAAHPIGYVSWFSAARFTNWMHNGGGINADTESGAYALTGALSGVVQRNAAADYWIPTENEWYKAAYYYSIPSIGGSVGGYWQYPTQSNDVTPATAVYATAAGQARTTSVFSGSAPSAFGTYHQGGNAWEYLDANGAGSRWLRGGGATSVKETLASFTDARTCEYGFGSFDTEPPDCRRSDVGFRLAAKGNPAPVLSISASSIAEGNDVGAVVGRLTAGNLDATDKVTFTLPGGNGWADNYLFEMVGNELRAKETFDYEARDSYSVRVLATSPGRLSSILTAAITITDVNEAPVDVSLSAMVAPENRPEGTVVGTLLTNDPDVGDRFSYSIVADATLDGTNLFEIVGNQVQTRATFSRDTKSSYSLRVRSIDSGGLSMEKLLTINVVSTPSAPVNIGAVASDRQARITWDSPTTDGGSAITLYVIEFRAQGSATWSNLNVFDPSSTSPKSATVTGLTNGTSYSFRVSAVNAIGFGPESAELAAVTPTTVPGAPPSVAGTAGNGKVHLSWAVPVDTGGAAITGYVVEYKAVTSATWRTFNDVISTATSATVTGLTNGTIYVFRVAAANSAGIGEASTPSAAVAIPTTVPSGPLNVVATAGNGRVSLAWTIPATNGGAAITGYVVQYKSTAATAWSTFNDGVPAVTSATVTGLANGTSYVFRVAAMNAMGTGAPSSPSVAMTPAAPAGPPRSVVANAGVGRVRLTWAAPTSNGGAGITDYVIQYRAAAANVWSTFTDGTSTATSATVTGLTKGVRYVFRVAAVNRMGLGSFSTNSAAVKPA